MAVKHRVVLCDGRECSRCGVMMQVGTEVVKDRSKRKKMKGKVEYYHTYNCKGA